MEAQREKGLRAIWCDYSQVPGAPFSCLGATDLSPCLLGLHPALWFSHSYVPMQLGSCGQPQQHPGAPGKAPTGGAEARSPQACPVIPSRLILQDQVFLEHPLVFLLPPTNLRYKLAI